MKQNDLLLLNSLNKIGNITDNTHVLDIVASQNTQFLQPIHTNQIYRILFTDHNIYPKAMKNILLVTIFLLSLAGAANAQATFYIDSITTSVGAKVKVGVRVKDFKFITGFQYSLRWDAKVIKYDTVEEVGLKIDPQFIGGDPDSIAAGSIGMLWTSSLAFGNTLNDGVTMLNFVFDVVGKQGDFTNVNFSNLPVELEVIDSSGVSKVPFTKNGFVKITQPNSTFELYVEKGGWKLFRPEPNPMINNGPIRWFMPISGSADISLIGLDGKQYFTHTADYGSGFHEMPLHLPNGLTPGSYVLVLRSGDIVLTQKILYNQQ